jgi:hypothetical protein
MEIKLGTGEYIVSHGTGKDVIGAVFIEKTPVPQPVGTKAEKTPLPEDFIAISFADKESAIVLIEQITQAILP